MSRQLKVVGVTVERPDERSTPETDRVGPGIAVNISHEHLKHRPVDTVRITEDDAIRLLEQLARALNIMRKEQR